MRQCLTGLLKSLECSSKSALMPLSNVQMVLLLYVAAAVNHTETVELLMKNRVNLKATANNGNTPLLQASNNGHIDVVTLLLENLERRKLRRR